MKTRHRVLCMLLALYMLATLLPGAALAADLADSGVCGDGLTWTLNDAGVLTISGAGDMADYTTVPAPWTPCSDRIRSVVIEDGVTAVGAYAFYECGSLTSISLPESIAGIGVFAFCRSDLTGVVIPDGVTRIESGTFSGCGSLTSVSIPESVTAIDSYAFHECVSLTAVVIPNSVTSFGDGVFEGCRSLTSVNIPENVTAIPNAAFLSCTSLTGITIPNSVTSIGIYAFYQSGLTGIAIPDSVATIDSCAFADCTSLTGIAVAAGNPSYTSADGVLFNKDRTTLVQYPTGKDGTAYVIPDSVTTIGRRAFSSCAGLTSVSIPDGVTAIEFGAFQYCSSLTDVTIPENVTILEEFAFSGSGLTSVSIPHGISFITFGVFSSCTGLTNISIPENVTYIGLYAFSNCTSLTDVAIPYSVTWIGECAFDACGSLANVYYAGFEDDWNAITILDCNTELISAALHYGRDYIPDTPAVPPAPDIPDPPDIPDKPAQPSFSDVKDSDFYAGAVAWAAENGITAGTGSNSFSPLRTCSRAEIVTFLYRAQGEPEVDVSQATVFTDVDATDFYAEAVAWALENEITFGTGSNSFSPLRTCSRAEIVTFLYRCQGQPSVSADVSFPDVSANSFYTDAVAWAVTNSVTAGTGSNAFSPLRACSRAEAVTLLYRAVA